MRRQISISIMKKAGLLPFLPRKDVMWNDPVYRLRGKHSRALKVLTIKYQSVPKLFDMSNYSESPMLKSTLYKSPTPITDKGAYVYQIPVDNE